MIEARGRAAELTEAQLLGIHELLVTGRALEALLQEAWGRGDVPADLFPGVGQEAAMVGLTVLLEDDDVFAGSHRDLVALLGRGVTVEQLVLNVFAKAAAPAAGKDSGIGLGIPERGVMMIEPHGPPNHQVAVGSAMAIAARAEGRVVLVSCGEGATAEGSWHEAVNVAAVHRLPVVFAVQTNGFAGPQRSDRVGAIEYAAHRADGYGVPGVVVDGTDVLECVTAAGEAIDRARSGGGPSVIEAVSFRRLGDTAARPGGSPDPDELASWAERDPIDRFEEYLGVRGLLDEVRRSAIRERAAERVGESIAWARSQGEPSVAALRAGVLAGRAVPTPQPAGGSARELSVRQALGEALDAALAEDEGVVVIGRDVGAAGGSHGVTAGLLGRYGPTRVIDVPGSAGAVVGAGIGAALEGLRPVVEVPSAGDVGTALLAGWAARHHWKTGRPVPMVVRVPWFPGAGLEAALCGVPGLRVVAAATAATAFGLLMAAIGDPNPVVLLEPADRYDERGPVPGGTYEIPLDAARVVRDGGEVTVVSWGSAVAVALEACELVTEVSVEVVDLVALAPLDWATVLESVRKTSRLVVLDGGAPVGGLAAEVAGRAAAEALWDLDGPVLRLVPPGGALPWSRATRREHLLTPDQVAEAVRSITST